jgi:uncharacterized protein
MSVGNMYGRGILLAVLAASSASYGRSEDLRLIDAVKAGDTTSITQLMRQHRDVNAREPDGSTALLWASYSSNADLVGALLRAGADTNLTNRYGVSPLLEACRIGNVAIIEQLLRRGAKLDTAYPDGETPLLAAAASGNLAAVNLLLDHGLDVNATEQVEHQTPLMWASEEGHLDVVRALLAKGADANLAAKISSLPYPSGDQGRSWSDHSHGGLTALMFAAREGHIDVVHTLLEEGHADPNAKTPGNVTAMLIAIMNDEIDTADLLLEHGADANDGSLHEMINLRSLRINATASDGSRPRPQHVNALSTTDFISHLLDHRGDPMKVVSYELRVNGASGAMFPRPVSESAYANALANQDVDVLRIMFARKVVDPNYIAEKKDLPLVAALGGGRPNFGGPPLPYRIPGVRGPLPAAQLLIEAGADVNAMGGPAKEAAIHRAALGDNLDVIRLLAQHGARLDAKNGAGLTALDLAAGKRPPYTGPKDLPVVLPPPVPKPQMMALLNELLAPSAVNGPAKAQAARNGAAKAPTAANGAAKGQTVARVMP